MPDFPPTLPQSENIIMQISHGSSASNGVHDTFRYGLASAKASVIKGHPLQQQQPLKTPIDYNLQRQVYGLAAPLRQMMDREIISQNRRIPVIKSSNFGLDVYNGDLDNIEFCDFLSDPKYSTVSVDVHASMERVLNMQ